MFGSSRKALRIVSSATREMPPLPPRRRAISGSSVEGLRPRFGEGALGQHHDEVLHALGVGHRVAVGGVVDAPLARRHPGLAAFLLDAGASDPRRHDLQVRRLGGARHGAAAQHAVARGFQAREHHVAGVPGAGAAGEIGVAVFVGREALEERRQPAAPEGHALAGADFGGVHQQRGLRRWRHGGRPGKQEDGKRCVSLCAAGSGGAMGAAGAGAIPSAAARRGKPACTQCKAGRRAAAQNRHRVPPTNKPSPQETPHGTASPR
ncbi:MAG: hypothetical protein U1F25_04330 [Rubrivivax sp.]